MFEPAKAVSHLSNDAPRAAFATFFSDGECELAEVNCAYRVALTYNLYYTDVRPSTNPRSSSGLMVQEESEISHHRYKRRSHTPLISTSTCSALLGLGLSYEYGIPLSEGRRRAAFEGCVCNVLQLETSPP
jgi:hypothetical protein